MRLPGISRGTILLTKTTHLPDSGHLNTDSWGRVSSRNITSRYILLIKITRLPRPLSGASRQSLRGGPYGILTASSENTIVIGVIIYIRTSLYLIRGSSTYWLTSQSLFRLRGTGHAFPVTIHQSSPRPNTIFPSFQWSNGCHGGVQNLRIPLEASWQSLQGIPMAEIKFKFAFSISSSYKIGVYQIPAATADGI